MAKLDPVALTQALIARPSVTPADAGAMDVVENHLQGLGFACIRLRFGEIENLYARRGTSGPNLCFAGHTDVVPGGMRSLWRYDPFGAEIHDGAVIGRIPLGKHGRHPQRGVEHGLRQADLPAVDHYMRIPFRIDLYDATDAVLVGALPILEQLDSVFFCSAALIDILVAASAH